MVLEAAMEIKRKVDSEKVNETEIENGHIILFRAHNKKPNSA